MSDIVQFVPSSGIEAYRASTDAAAICREIVLRTALIIPGRKGPDDKPRKYVRIEGWQAIATAHGCVGSACDIERVEGGYRARGQVKRMSDGMVIAEGEGFVGEDEPDWFGGMRRKWRWGQARGEKVWYEEEAPPRPAYAIRAMAQTRAISRACRSAFAHVVVLIDENLSTTPAEEVPFDGFQDDAPGPIANDIPAADHPNAPRAARSRQEPAQAPRPDPAPAEPPAQQRPQAAFQRGPDGRRPEPAREINRIGHKVPAPMGNLPQDWMRWQRAVARRIEAAKSADEIDRIEALHADDVVRSNDVVQGSMHAFAELVGARRRELEGKAA